MIIDNDLIPAEDLVKHYSSLNNKNPSNDQKNSDHCNRIRALIDQYCAQSDNYPSCPILDKSFTPIEIAMGLKIMKRGKSLV